MRVVFAALVSLFFATQTAIADELVSGLSQDLIQITSNYAGSEIVVFGAIEHPDSDTGERDVMVILRGPDEDMTVRRKDRIAGIWINNARAVLADMPSFYVLASTRPITSIAPEGTLARYGIGLANLMPTSFRGTRDPEPFRLALIRHNQRIGLYAEKPNAVEFLSSTLFRARIAIPAIVPRGQYNAEVYLFREGTVIAAQSTPLYIDQTGLERRVNTLAHNSPFTYGLATVLMAAALGWLSTFVFRKSA